MEVGQAATYVTLSGKTRDCLVAKIENGKASIVVIDVDGPSDHLGRLRRELYGVRIGEKLGCVCDLDTWDPLSKEPKKKPAKKNNKKSAKKNSKKKAAKP